MPGLAAFAPGDRRRVDRTDLEVLQDLQSFRPQRRREVDHEVFRHALALERGRLGGEGLRRRIPLSRQRALLDRTLFDRPHRLAGLAIEHKHPTLLGRLRNRRDPLAVDRDVDQHRRAGDVVIPDRMVHELVVPDALAGLQIDGDETLGEEIVAGTMAAEIIAGRFFDGQVGDAEILVDGHLRPDAGVAGVLPRLLQPRVVAELAGLRNGVEDPQPLARAGVVAADVALGVLHAARRRARRDARRRPARRSSRRPARRSRPLRLRWDRCPGRCPFSDRRRRSRRSL